LRRAGANFTDVVTKTSTCLMEMAVAYSLADQKKKILLDGNNASTASGSARSLWAEWSAEPPCSSITCFNRSALLRRAARHENPVASLDFNRTSRVAGRHNRALQVGRGASPPGEVCILSSAIRIASVATLIFGSNVSKSARSKGSEVDALRCE
jgi:hypothetical protein